MADWGKLGGSHPMHSNTGTGPQKSGVSSQEGGHSGMDPGATVTGGNNTVFVGGDTTNKDFAGSQKPGVSAATKSGGDAKFASGGSHSTLGNRGSLPARGGHSAP